MAAHRSTGFSLIEVLISLVIVSIGLLGAASLQLNALQASSVSHERTLAIVEVDSFFERLWANACHVWEGDAGNRELNADLVETIHEDWLADARDRLKRLESIDSEIRHGSEGRVSVELNWSSRMMMADQDSPVTARVVHTKRVMDPQEPCS